MRMQGSTMGLVRRWREGHHLLGYTITMKIPRTAVAIPETNPMMNAKVKKTNSGITGGLP